MANVLVEESYLQNIANSIRALNGTNNKYTPAQMSSAINSISGIGEVTKSGTHVTVPSGYVACQVNTINEYMSRKVIKIL